MNDFVQGLRLWFAPERIRDEGDTPDYRFSLANERTFLAWIRTALALIGGGFAVDQFLPDLAWGVRAGLALALLAAGVDREAVIEDYARTESNLAGEWLEEMVALVGRYGVPDSPELRVLMGGSPREAIEGVIETIERDHGSTREYLIVAGLSLHDLAALERLLIDPA